MDMQLVPRYADEADAGGGARVGGGGALAGSHPRNGHRGRAGDPRGALEGDPGRRNGRDRRDPSGARGRSRGGPDREALRQLYRAAGERGRAALRPLQPGPRRDRARVSPRPRESAGALGRNGRGDPGRGLPRGRDAREASSLGDRAGPDRRARGQPHAGPRADVPLADHRDRDGEDGGRGPVRIGGDRALPAGGSFDRVADGAGLRVRAWPARRRDAGRGHGGRAAGPDPERAHRFHRSGARPGCALGRRAHRPAQSGRRAEAGHVRRRSPRDSSRAVARGPAQRAHRHGHAARRLRRDLAKRLCSPRGQGWRRLRRPGRDPRRPRGGRSRGREGKFLHRLPGAAGGGSAIQWSGALDVKEKPKEEKP